MPRKPLLLQSVYPYHVTARSNNREWFYLPSSEIWLICGHLLAKVEEKYQAGVLEFVLMSNHFHLLIETPGSNLDRIMNYFMREFSRTVGTRAGRINHVFGGRYNGSLIRDPWHFLHVYKYVLRNPVAAGMEEKVEDYVYSTLRRELGERYPFPVLPILDHSLSALIPRGIEGRLEWLNLPYEAAESELLRRALKQTEFRFPSHRRHSLTVSCLSLPPRQK